MDTRCVNCAESGDFCFDCLKRHRLQSAAKICIRNLPPDISESGLRNLFLGVGTPTYIRVVARDLAIAEFRTMNEAELAIRDLNKKPPYNLKVYFTSSKNYPSNKNLDSNNEPWNLDQHIVLKNIKQKEPPLEFVDNDSSTVADNSKLKHKNFKSLNFEASVRMRQKYLDYKTQTSCVSRGRGYMYMGPTDRFIGGSKTSFFTSKDDELKDQINSFCSNCNFMTSKICAKCSVSFCSEECYNNIDLHERVNSKECRPEEKFYCQSKQKNYRDPFTFKKIYFTDTPYMPFNSSCTVLITMFINLKIIYIRRIDSPWDEKFTQFSNRIAKEAMKDDKLEVTPKKGDLCISRYYEDMCYYRAKIISVEEKSAVVIFVDFGNTQTTKLCDLKPLPDEYKLIPEYAVKVQMKEVPEVSSCEAITYYNRLTAERIPLTMKFVNDSTVNEVYLTEKDTELSVNKKVLEYIKPSWKKNKSVLSKSGDIFYLENLRTESLELSKTYNLVLSHFNKDEFIKNGIFWVNIESDTLLHVKNELSMRITEYCQFLEDDCYLPRTNELCLAQNEGVWGRCVNLNSVGTTCCLFFIDQGYTVLVKTMDIRKFIEDFLEAPAQAICCGLTDNLKFQTDSNLQSKVVEYMTSFIGQTLPPAFIKEYNNDIFYISIDKMTFLNTDEAN